MFKRRNKKRRYRGGSGDGVIDFIGDFVSALIFFSWLDD